ncbi:hypothetical protein KC360_g8519 [Hortaea werneckii]|nr:hypothetical protein KC325_g8539 [Hortaea werneckii]KAI6986435.1 hypothetical protein KC359_g8748 [Hortaea werneckii]KAI7140706.1 hypothetical protein KC344_g8522 [Hortaea werneckii]KAI7167658.1 hypothetical protein KC360_g8519 [Hortaea werneckii]
MASSTSFTPTAKPKSPISYEKTSKVTVAESQADLISYLLLDPPSNKTLKRWLGFGLNFTYYNHLRDIDPTGTHFNKETWYRALAWLQKVENEISQKPYKNYREYVKADVDGVVLKHEDNVRMRVDEKDLKYYRTLGAIIFHWSRDLSQFENDDKNVCPEDKWADFWVETPSDGTILQDPRTLPWRGEPAENKEETDVPAETSWREDLHAAIPDKYPKPKHYVHCPCKVCFKVDGAAEERDVEERFSDAIASGKEGIGELRLNCLLDCEHPGAFRDLGRWRQNVRNQASLSHYYFDFNSISMECYTQPYAPHVSPVDVCIIFQKGVPMDYDEILDQLALHNGIVEIHFEVKLKPVESVVDESCRLPKGIMNGFEFDDDGDVAIQNDGRHAVIAKTLAKLDVRIEEALEFYDAESEQNSSRTTCSDETGSEGSSY